MIKSKENRSESITTIIIFVCFGNIFFGCNSEQESLPKSETNSVQTTKQIITALDQNKPHSFELAKNWSFGYENYRNGEYQKAVKYFWEVSKLDTLQKFPKVYCYISECYIALGKPDSASIVDEIGRKKYADVFCRD